MTIAEALRRGVEMGVSAIAAIFTVIMFLSMIGLVGYVLGSFIKAGRGDAPETENDQKKGCESVEGQKRRKGH